MVELIEPKMIPAGYMAKRLATRPEWLASVEIHDIYSLSSCISEDFDDYTDLWKHSGYGLFDSPLAIRENAIANAIDLRTH